MQLFRTITQECAGHIFKILPEGGALFEVIESPLIKELGDAEFLLKSRHYIVCCYEEVIEVAAWEAEVTSETEASQKY